MGMKYVNPSTNEELHFGDIITKTTTKFTYDGIGKEITSVSFLFNADSKDNVNPVEVNKVAVVPPKAAAPTPAPKTVQIPTPNPATNPPSVLPT